MDMIGKKDEWLEKGPLGLDASPAMVTFENVQKTYDGEALVVRDLNLTVRQGEFLTMLGPSGSGKTTTLMMLGGFEQPTSGHIRLGGQAVERLPPEKRNIGFVFQNYALFPHMTVHDNIAFPLRYRGIRGADASARVKAALDMVKLDGLSERKPQQLSGGQQQRVALARAMVFNPKLILMDEPLGALDKQLREHMQIEIKQIQKRLGITMVYVTHDQSEALTMSDRIAIFHEGRIQQLSDPVSLYNSPENRFVANFIGDNNTLPCTVLAIENGMSVLQMADGAVLKGAGNDVKVGQPVTVSIRPESLGFHSSDLQVSNLIEGTVLDSIFLGDRARLSVKVFGDEQIVASVPAKSVGLGLAPGTLVRLRCDATDCRILTQ
ncbi:MULTISPECIES: ABC transporter ATP-binding protein [Agrobacterium]|uniref:Spermidine/putrescine import ATP-binding protein PotA n=2 Tax=Agrobacterium pusense TaxID=648995 RepID=A0AA44EG70_9HYPH|nr:MULTISPECIES: ABC transporter ATP-binding protein [Agrobacterium]MDH0617073.1 ABC transporter ATP-binding protein [Agrobacterium sp. GD03872]MDH0699803.1 ABC transporter ATP-binding protein [Agrobacterium sp. GD03871]MDH1062694.1 ABC transporter ATP-binding protein [Agrobacterium sp. GD03992]MDH2213990.1 ABC transporter ATP-binding protein [Agrobacterium sp. GD03643]MDH2222837.1 ABC transporter ATP-binding protein [Agrobacterium sp. GD03638]